MSDMAVLLLDMFRYNLPIEILIGFRNETGIALQTCASIIRITVCAAPKEDTLYT